MTEYFPHDYDARNDPKITRLIRKHGWEAYGIYWAITEKLHSENGFLETNYEEIAYDFRADEEVVRSIINDFSLFKISDNKFTSKRVLENIMFRQEKSEKASKSVSKRWQMKYEELIKETKFDFESVWGSYPRQDSKIECLNIFIDTVLTQEDFNNLIKAIENYKKYIQKNEIEQKFVKKDSTFFKVWQEWINWTPSVLGDEIPAEWRTPAKRK